MEEQLTIHEQIELLEKLTQNTIEYQPNGQEKTEKDFIAEILSQRRKENETCLNERRYKYVVTATDNSDFANVCRKIEYCFQHTVKSSIEIDLDGCLKRNYLINDKKLKVISDLTNSRILIHSSFSLDDYMNALGCRKQYGLK